MSKKKTYKLEVKGTSPTGLTVEMVRHIECKSRDEARGLCYDTIVFQQLSEASFKVDDQSEGSHTISIGGSKQ
jgi:hypothetical protein